MSRSFTDRSRSGINTWQLARAMPGPVSRLWSNPPGPANALLVPPPVQQGVEISLDVEALANRLDLITQTLIFFELVRDLFNRMQSRGVVASTECFADSR